MSNKDLIVKFNKCAYFMLPLVNLNTQSYGNNTLTECYITMDKEIILKLNGSSITDIKSREHHLETWYAGHNTWMKYSIPERFKSDFDAFIKGQYSCFSEDAYLLIRNSIEIISIDIARKDNAEKKIDHSLIKSYLQKMHDSKHPIIYKLDNRVNEIVLAPVYLGSIAPKENPQRASLRTAIGKDLGMDIPEDTELYEKPVLEKEIFQEKKKITISADLFKKLHPRGQFYNNVYEKDANIKIKFTDTDNHSHDYNIAKVDSKKFVDIHHLGNYIRSMIRKKLAETDLTYTAVCEINPWNIKIEVDKENFYRKDS